MFHLQLIEVCKCRLYGLDVCGSSCESKCDAMGASWKQHATRCQGARYLWEVGVQKPFFPKQSQTGLLSLLLLPLKLDAATPATFGLAWWLPMQPQSRGRGTDKKRKDEKSKETSCTSAWNRLGSMLVYFWLRFVNFTTFWLAGSMLGTFANTPLFEAVVHGAGLKLQPSLMTCFTGLNWRLHLQLRPLTSSFGFP